jgi:aminoglycoside phosphotransferase (APT) family kinase protein
MVAHRDVVIHGDYRLDNLVFPHDADAPAIVYDWQAVRLGAPLVDAALYLGGCLTIADRRAHERELLREYHDRLCAAGVGALSWDALWKAYRWSVFYGLLLTIPFSAQVERSERNDQLYGLMIRGYAQQARDLDSEAVL